MRDDFGLDLGSALDPGVLARYLAAECTPDEARQVERWMATQPERRRWVQELAEARRLAGEVRHESYDVQAAWHRTRVLAATSHRRAGILRRFAVAAGLVLAIGAGAWAVLGDPNSAATPTALRQITTRPGQRANVYLSDGTHVVLGAASRLRFAAPLSKTSRDVYLEGEALFTVVHDAEWPFLVHAGGAVTEDLGTKFSVRAYSADSMVTVVVAEGKVALRDGRRRAAYLGPGDLAKLTAAGALDTERGVSLEPYFAWAEGHLVFKGTPLRDVLPQLARWYDIDIRLADPALGARRLTITVTSESTEDLLRYVALALDLSYKRTGRNVMLYSK